MQNVCENLVVYRVFADSSLGKGRFWYQGSPKYSKIAQKRMQKVEREPCETGGLRPLKRDGQGAQISQTGDQARPACLKARWWICVFACL